jgi:shikimate dehydrogenase
VRYRLVVLGDPVEHSRSPLMHNAALRALGLEGRYEARRVDEAGMREAAAEMRRGLLDGANITMPHKRLAFELADQVEGEARRAGSVNTWVVREAVVVGHSTDIPAIRRVFRQRRLPEGAVTILGAGGAAAAALVALADRPVTVVARRPDAAGAMIERCRVPAAVVSWDEAMIAGGTVVNCTSLGMDGEAIPSRLLDGAEAWFEMVYARGATPAERIARGRGLPVSSGLDLLVAQAEASFELWTGLTPPAGIMYRAVDKVLKDPHGGAE